MNSVNLAPESRRSRRSHWVGARVPRRLLIVTQWGLSNDSVMSAKGVPTSWVRTRKHQEIESATFQSFTKIIRNLFFKNGPGRSKWSTRKLWEFCGS
jgi:hypothetical protein